MKHVGKRRSTNTIKMEAEQTEHVGLDESQDRHRQES
jgi:hypothetical protein